MSMILEAFLENEAGLKRYLARFCETADEVNEIAQETFLRAYAAERRYEITAHKAFLYRIAKNTALEAHRRKKIVSASADSDASELLVDEDQPSADQMLDGRRKLRAFAMAVAKLPPQCRAAFTLRHVDGLKHKQIAERMNISVSAVEKHLATALVKCRAYLQASGYDASEFGAARPATRAASDRDAKDRRG